jgi:hypothetical protein
MLVLSLLACLFFTERRGGVESGESVWSALCQSIHILRRQLHSASSLDPLTIFGPLTVEQHMYALSQANLARLRHPLREN